MKIKVVERVVDTSVFHTGSFVKRYTLYRRFLFLFWKRLELPVSELCDRVEQRTKLYISESFLNKDFAIEVCRHCVGNKKIKYRGYVIEPTYNSRMNGSFGYRVVVDSHTGYKNGGSKVRTYDVFSSFTVDVCKSEIDKIMKIKNSERYEREYWREEIVEV